MRRSGRCSKNQASTKATATTAAAIRKTVCIESVKAMFRGWSSASSVASRLAKIAPRIEVPSEPPIERNRVADEVATPSCS